MKYLFFKIGLLLCITAYNQNTDPEVGLRTGKILFPTSIQHRDQGLPTDHLLLDNQDQVGIKLVRHYQTNSDYFIIYKFDDVGYVRMRRTEQGAVSIFKFSKNTYDPYWIGNGGGHNNYTYYSYQDELRPLSNDNLKKTLAHDTQSVQMIKKIVRNNFIRVGAFAGGLALTALGVSKMFVPDEQGVNRFEFSPNLPFVAGVPIIVLSITIGQSKKQNLGDVIKAYNFKNR